MSPRRVHGPAVRAIREAMGIRHGVFARRVGISAPHLTNIESGIKQPSPTVAVEMAKHLGVTFDAIAYSVAEHERNPAPAEAVA